MRQTLFHILVLILAFIFVVYVDSKHLRGRNRRNLGDNDHKKGPHFHDLNYHAHDPRDEARLKKRSHWLNELDKDPLQQKRDADRRYTERLRREEKKEEREYESKYAKGRYADDDHKSEINQKIVDAYEKKQEFHRREMRKHQREEQYERKREKATATEVGDNLLADLEAHKTQAIADSQGVDVPEELKLAHKEQSVEQPSVPIPLGVDPSSSAPPPPPVDSNVDNSAPPPANPDIAPLAATPPAGPTLGTPPPDMHEGAAPPLSQATMKHLVRHCWFYVWCRTSEE